MHEELMIGIGCIVVLGIAAQWLAWSFYLPSILLLLAFGFAAGPLTGFLDPDHLLGDLLLPVVSLSVAIILFEGGLTLRFNEIKKTGFVIRNLITIGAAATWLTGALSAWLLLGFEAELALLLGAILVVSGPTVIGPLLAHVRPRDSVGSALKWEGILIDPVGAIMAVLIFDVIILEQEAAASAAFIAFGVLKTAAVGFLLGIAAGWLLILLFREYWVPDFLQNPVSLMTVIAVFVLSNHLQEESGLLTVIVMGIALANQKQVPIQHIIDFKEDLRVLLLSGVFVILVARLPWEQISQYDLNSLLFLLSLVLVARPVSVWLSTLGSEFNWRERAFIAWMAPRGIVAAAVASVFSIRLADSGYPGAEELVSVTFLVIAGTVLLYGFTAKPVARRLGVSQPNANGVLFVGAHAWARAAAAALREEGFPVLLVDRNREQTYAARMEGLPTFHGNIFTEYIGLGAMGKLMAVTSNEELNSLACLHFSHIMPSSEVYQLEPGDSRETLRRGPDRPHIFGRLLFGKGIKYSKLKEYFDKGYRVKKTNLTDEFTYDEFREYYGNDVIPLFLIDENDRLLVFTAERPPIPRPGHRIIGLVPPNGTKNAV